MLLAGVMVGLWVWVDVTALRVAVMVGLWVWIDVTIAVLSDFGICNKAVYYITFFFAVEQRYK